MKYQKGQILLFALVFMVAISTIVAGLVAYAAVQIRSHRQAVGREQGIDIAEAGIETAIWKLNNQSGYTGESNTAYANGTYTVAVSNYNFNTKLIKVDSYIPNSTNPTAHRTVQIKARIGIKNFGFKYGVQTGVGGLVMDNNSTVTGNIYSNGDIVGANNGAVINGDTVVAGSSGSISKVTINGDSSSHSIVDSTVTQDASHYSLVRTSVTGNASVNSLAGPGCSIIGNAAYNTLANCTISGTITSPNSNVPADPPTIALPIDAAQVTTWEQEATAGGTMNGTTINGTLSLGPIKVVGDLIVNGTLNITGTVWITGSLTFNNGSTVQLTSDFGALSGQILVGTSGVITTGYININNGTIINGSGTAGSYIMLLSERDTRGNGNVAITAANNVAAAILYANDGLVEVVNRAELKSITAWKVHLNNETEVVYDTSYGSAEFGAGGTNGWEIFPQTWQLLR